jgi:DNA-binding response OmpR family regulator
MSSTRKTYEVSRVKLLIVEHDPALGLFLARSLERDQHTITLVNEGAAAVLAIASADYDLLLLDFDLPGEMGMRVLEAARQLGNGMRVLVLGAGAVELEFRIRSLQAGADDCLAKPFAMRELRLRCEALGRRHDGHAVLRCGSLELNRLEQSLACDQGRIALSRREFAVLEFLMMHRGNCVSRATLLENVWSAAEGGNTNVVDVYINYLRRKLGPNGALIETVRGQGYRIAAPEKARLAQPIPMLLSAAPAFSQAAVS